MSYLEIHFERSLHLHVYSTDYSIEIWLEKTKAHNSIDPIISWCFKMGLLETMEILVGKKLKPKIDIRA